nr:hypothetical protein [Tanacetum cinerariifolium]
MHNNIMAAGSRDRPPMLAPGRYPQWRSRCLRYVDTRPNGEALRKYIMSGPYKPTTVLVYAVEATDNSPAVPEHTTLETPSNMSPENKAHFLAEKETIHLILTGIGYDIYSTVDACQTAHEMWEAIERLQQGESLNIQDVKTNLFWEFGKFTSHDGETMESYYTRFYKLMNEMIRNNLTVTTMQVNVNFFNNFSRNGQVNELRAEKLTRNTNPLALVATAQASQDPFYQSSRSHISQAPSPKPSIPSKSHTSIRHKGKEIAKPLMPPSETTSEEDNDPEQAKRDKDMEKNLALIAKYFKKIYKPTNNNHRTSLNSKNKNVDTTLWYKNDDHSGQFGTQRTVNVAGTRDKVGSPVVQKSGIHYMAEIQEVPIADSGTDSEPVEQTKQTEFEKYKAFNDRTVDYDKLEQFLNEVVYKRSQSIQTIRMMAPKVSTYNGRPAFTNPRYLKQAQSEILCLYAYPYDQSTHVNRLIPDGEETLALERESRSKLNKDSVHPYDYTKLNSLYDIFKPPTQEYETQLAHANEIGRKMWQKSFVKSKPNIYKNVAFLPISKSISNSRQAYNVITNNINHFKQICDDAWTKHSKDIFCAPTALDIEILIQTYLMPLAIKTQGDSLKFVHELKQEMHADLKYIESLEKEIDELESKKAEFSDVYDVQLQLEWSRFVMIVKQQHKLMRNANPLALVATAQADRDQYYQTSRSHRSSAPSPKPSIPSRSHTTTRHKGKEIAKPITPSYETASEEDIDPEQAQRDKDMQKNLALIAKYFKKIYKPTNNNLRPSLNSKNKNVDTTPRKPKRVKDSMYHKEKMWLCKQAEQGVSLQAEQYDWLADTDEEVDEQELEAHYSYMAKIQEVLAADSGTDSEPVEQNEQNDVESDDERVSLANLIANLKLDTKQAEFEKYKAFNDHTVDYDKLERKLNEALGQLAHKDTVIREGLKSKAYELSVVKEKHDELMKQSLLTKSHYEGLVKQKTNVITNLKLREEHDIEKMLSMEKQLKFLNEIVYKRSQSIQTIHMMAPKVPTYNGRPTFANPIYLKQAQSEIPCLYAFPYD